jgi:hypothetical protein
MAKSRPLYIPADNPYPKMVYPGAPKPGTGKIVNSKEEHEALLALAIPEPKAEVTEEKENLLKEAEALGVEIDKRWGLQKLKDAIAEKRKAA